MNGKLSPRYGITVTILAVAAIAVAAFLVGSIGTDALARNNIRSTFFDVYPEALETQLEALRCPRGASAPCPLYFSRESAYTVGANLYCGGERIRRGWRKYGKRAEVPSTS